MAALFSSAEGFFSLAMVRPQKRPLKAVEGTPTSVEPSLEQTIDQEGDDEPTLQKEATDTEVRASLGITRLCEGTRDPH